jgi:tRNA pseudouridine38-40 synthase
VHARGQVASFASAKDRDPARLRHALNRLLPEDIGIPRASIEADDFHARRAARGRVYRYRVATGAYLSPFDAPFAWHFRSELEVSAMALAAGHLIGEHDFSAFRAAGDVSATPVKSLRSCVVTRDGDRIDLTVEGSSFLQHMVRTIAGTLVEVGRGHRPPSWVAEVLASRDRSMAGPTAPARGLTLERVIY